MTGTSWVTFTIFERGLLIEGLDHLDLGDLNSDLLNVVHGHFTLLLSDDDLRLCRADHGRGAATGGVGAATADAADAAAVLAEASAVSPGGHHDGGELADGDGHGLGDFLLDGLHLFDHPDGASLDSLQSVLQHGLHFHFLDLDDLLNNFIFRYHLDLLDHFRLFDELGPRLLHLLNLHHDLGGLLQFFPENHFLAFDGFGLVFDSTLVLLLLFENNPLDSLGHRLDHFLLPGDRLHLPLGALSRSVLVLVVDVAVLVTMELVGDVLDLTSAACAERAAGARRDFSPESSGLVVAAATAAGSATALFALTTGVFHSLVVHVEPWERAVLQLVGVVGR